ncbi:hypothetical protein [uncultured Parasutterella sp.]|uniref:hypothetical protein n=1 Tax=uncultured Parasutterella sp. TaxID=1263098 RepID=UPI002729A0CC|nr:hypothetical protein [uncultured Parasutterella sp.]
MTDREKRLKAYRERLQIVIEDWETGLRELDANGAITDSDLEDEGAVIDMFWDSIEEITLLIKDEKEKHHAK